MNDAVMTSRDDVIPADDELPFRLESVRRDDSSYDLRLVVTLALDREVRRQTLLSIHTHTTAVVMTRV